MAKRFTDTDKWKREWFYELKPNAKLVWLYLLDQCDHSGIWPRNFKLLSEQIGLKVQHKDFVEWFGSKLILFDTDKYFIPSFFEFQYGSSKDGFKAKASALAKLQELGLFDSDGNLNTNEHLSKCPEQSMDCPSIGISNSIGKSKSKSNNELREKIEKIYKDHYPLKKGFTKGLERLLRDLKLDEVPLFESSVIAYRADCERNKTEPEFIKHFSTFAGVWRDWLDPQAGTSITSVKPDIFSQIDFGDAS